MGSVLRFWPWFALGTAFVVGAAIAGAGGGTLAVTLGILVVGPGYLIQQRIRRRRGVEPRSVLNRDADEIMVVAARRYLLALDRRPGLRLFLTVVTFGELATLWFVLGKAWAIAGLVLLVLTVSAGYARRLRR